MSSKKQIIVAIVVIVIVVVAVYFGMGYYNTHRNGSSDGPLIVLGSTSNSGDSVGCKIATPENPEAYANGDGKIIFKWDGVPGANNYILYLGDDEDTSPEQFLQKIETSTNPFIWDIPADTGPHSNMKLFFCIVARRDVCSVNTSEECVGCLSKPTEVLPVVFNCPLPNSPVLFDDTIYTDGTIFVSWSPIDDAIQYTLYFLKQDLTKDNNPGPDSYDEKVNVDHPTWWYVFELPDDSPIPWLVSVTATNKCGESLPSLTFQSW